MRRYSALIFTLMVLMIFSGERLVRGQDHVKIAQSGMQFLSVTTDAYAAALGGAVFTHPRMKSTALFFNPACMAVMEDVLDIAASKNRWIADINYNSFSLAFRPFHGEYGVVGISLITVDYGELIGTMVDKSQALGYIETGIFSPSAMAVGFGYARRLSDRFSVGGQVKWVRQTLGENQIPLSDSTTATVKNELTPFAFDFGTLFYTGFKSLAFGMSVRNFSSEVKFEEEGFQLPLSFTMGISMDIMDLIDIGNIEQSLILSIDATHYRSHREQLCVGLDYQFMHILSLRSGYFSGNDENGLTFGMGISHRGFGLDYAYTPFGIFDKVQRVSARFSL